MRKIFSFMMMALMALSVNAQGQRQNGPKPQNKNQNAATPQKSAVGQRTSASQKPAAGQKATAQKPAMKQQTPASNRQGVNQRNNNVNRNNRPAPVRAGSGVYHRSGKYSFFSNSLKIAVELNSYGRYSSLIVDGTEFLATVSRDGHIIAKEDDMVVFDGYMYNGGKSLRGRFYGREAHFERR